MAVYNHLFHDVSIGGNSTSAGAGYQLLSSGTIFLMGGNNITLSQNGQSISISAGAGGGGIDASIGGNSTSAGGGYQLVSSGTLILAGGNNITLSQNGQSITISAFTQTVQTQNLIDVTLGGNSTSAGGGFQLVSSGTLFLAGGNNITLSQNGQSITISAFTQTAQTQNIHNVTLGGNSTSAGAGFILISSGTMFLAGGNNITLSQNGQSITISAANGGGAGDGYNIVSMLTSTSGGGTAGATFSNSAASIGFMAGSNITLSQTSNTINIVGPGAGSLVFNAGSNISLSSSSAGVSTTLTIYATPSASIGFTGPTNTFGTSGSVSNQFILAGANNISLSGSTNAGGMTVTIMDQPLLSYWEMPVRAAAQSGTMVNGTMYVQPFFLETPIAGYRMQFVQSNSTQLASTMSISASVSGGSASSGSGLWTVAGTVLLLSRQSTGTDAHSSNLRSYYSNTYSYGIGMSMSVSWSTNASSATASFSSSGAISFLSQIDSTGGTTSGSFGSTGSGSFSSTSTAAHSFSSSSAFTLGQQVLSQFRPIMVPFNTTMSQGEWWLGHIRSSGSASTNYNLANVLTFTPALVCYNSATAPYAEIGSSVTIAGSNYVQGWGSYGTSANSTTTFAISNISNNSNIQTWFNIQANIK